MGPNGAGKSTVAGMVVGELAPVSGNAWRHPLTWRNFFSGAVFVYCGASFDEVVSQWFLFHVNSLNFSQMDVFYTVLACFTHSPGMSTNHYHYQCRIHGRNLRMAYVAQHAFHHLEEHLELTAVEMEA